MPGMKFRRIVEYMNKSLFIYFMKYSYALEASWCYIYKMFIYHGQSRIHLTKIHLSMSECVHVCDEI